MCLLTVTRKSIRCLFLVHTVHKWMITCMPLLECTFNLNDYCFAFWTSHFENRQQICEQGEMMSEWTLNTVTSDTDSISHTLLTLTLLSPLFKVWNNCSAFHTVEKWNCLANSNLVFVFDSTTGGSTSYQIQGFTQGFFHQHCDYLLPSSQK